MGFSGQNLILGSKTFWGVTPRRQAQSADGAPEVVFTLYEPYTNGTYKRFNRNYPHKPLRKDLQAQIQICSMGFVGRKLILGSKIFLCGGDPEERI